MLRKLMRSLFPAVLSISFFASMLLAIGFGMFNWNPPSMYYTILLWKGVLTLGSSVVGVILLYGALCTLLDIRDALEKRNQ